MPLLGKIFVYMVIWWVVLFTVLPWGVHREQNPEAGHDPGAPANPRLKAKLVTTSLIALVIWSIAFFIIDYYGVTLAIFERAKP